MAWTAITSGADYSVGEVVTASKLNSHVGDNLRFLKGLDGDIHLEDDLGIGTSAPMQYLTAATYDRGITSASSGNNLVGALLAEGHRSGGDAAFGAIAAINRAATGTDRRGAIMHFIRDTDDNSAQIAFGTRNAGTVANKMFLKRDGKLGLNTLTPQGLLHGYNTISGFLHWEFNGVDGTARTVIPDGAGDVTAGLTGVAVAICNDNTVKHGALASATGALGTAGLTPGGSAYTIGQNSGATQLCTLTVNANGSVQVQRTTGASATWQVALWLLWL